ncbi:MAG TPA: methyl-accepting chemotaxis protein, partial [Gemmataceae bacterium]|nr:methyl-accepting chemotaxis protein [Gemmataceae bacterium]
MLMAQRVGSDLGTVNAVVGHITLSEHCATCHGVATGGDRSEQIRTAKECRSLLADMKTKEQTADGKKLLGELDAAGAGWLDANLKVLELGLAGKRAKAAEAYRDESIPSVGPVQHALAGYVSWQQQRLQQKRESADKLMRKLPIPITALSFIALTISTLLGVVISRSISGPLAAAVSHLGEVAGGDVSREVSAEYLERGDEIGLLARTMQSMSASLRDVIKNMTGGIGVLFSSSADLSANSTQMSDGSREASGKAHSVASAAEQMTANVVSVAAGMEQTSTNLSSVASATEQMTATIGEIAGNSEKARRITEDATRQA